MQLILSNPSKKIVADIPDLKIEVDFAHAPPISNVGVAETLLRCTQEAVTNVVRHAQATLCEIAFSNNEQHYLLSVRDNGKNVGEIDPGNGLKGMLERVTAEGGSLSWEQDQEGFQLFVKLPMGSHS